MAKNTQTLYEQAVADLKSLQTLSTEAAKSLVAEQYDAIHQANLEQKLREMDEADDENVDDLDENSEIDMAKLFEVGDEADDDDDADQPKEGEDAPEGGKAPEFGAEAPEGGEGELDLTKTLADTTVEELSTMIDAAIQKAMGGGATDGAAPEAEATDVAGGIADAGAAPIDDMHSGEEDDEDKVDEELARLLAELKTVTKPTKTVKKSTATVAQLQEQLTDALKANKVLTTGLQEQKVFNARLLYCNMLFGKTNLSESIKVQIAKRLDSAKTIGEAKAIYEALKVTIDQKPSRKTPQNLHESIGGASRPAGSSTRTAPATGEESDFYKRMRVLGNVPKKN